MEYRHILYQPGAVARIILNRPRYRNAQSARMNEELDDAFRNAGRDPEIRVIILSGAGTSFCAGHDIGTAEELEDPNRWMAPEDRLGRYVRQREQYVEATLRWRNVPKPTIAMIHGYCIFGGWIFAAAMDLVFAAGDALFLPSNLQYFSAPWDVGPKKAKEILFEGRFLRAREAMELGFVNRVYAPEHLERETLVYAERVAARGPATGRMTKFMVNNALDMMGYTPSVEAGYQTYAFTGFPENLQAGRRREGQRRQLAGVTSALELLKNGIPPLDDSSGDHAS
ncbi:MAG: enoyl-CoA hydratase-related protein [Dehalococcoidia bacterium]